MSCKYEENERSTITLLQSLIKYLACFQSRMYHCCKEEGEKSGLDMDTTQIKTENHEHTLRFRSKSKTYAVTCNAPMTVLQRLQTDSYFKKICEEIQEGGNKELLILREKMLRAAVTPDFPCCLLKDNEVLDIKFITPCENNKTEKTPKLTLSSLENLVSFFIRTRGDENIRMVIKNNSLKRMADYVCVYGVKGEKVKAALKRDGRFNSVIFRKGALYEQGTGNTMNLSNLIDCMNGKYYHFTHSPHQTGSQEMSQESSQEMTPEFKTEKDEKSEIPETSQATNTNHNSTNAEEKKREAPLKEKKCRKYPDTKEIPNTQEILNLLRDQHKDLLKTLKERENLKNNVEVKRFFREEYDKSVYSFSEVKRVKDLMELSDSVCQIRINGSAVGTGFLLFYRFVLTNAHVVGGLFPATPRLRHKLTAVFDFEDLDSGKLIQVEENVVAYFSGKDDMGNHLDFALLELSSDEKFPDLLTCYSAPPARGGVCIIGHPGGGVKQMDPCFIIPKEDVEQDAERHLETNQNFPGTYMSCLHVITQQCLAEDREKRNSQILYNSCFFHGSSGSPVFDEHCNLIGVHTGGYTYEEKERKKTRSVMEYALPMFPILVQIFIQCRWRERSDVVQYFEGQNNMKYVLKVANEQLQRNHQTN